MVRNILAVVLVSLAFTAQAKVIQVLPGHNTLQPAIDQLVNGDTLVLVDGTYTHDTTIVVTVSATIRSISPSIQPRIVRTGGSSPSFWLQGSASVAVVQGLRFSDNSASSTPSCNLRSDAVELRLINNVVDCGFQTIAGENVIVGNSFIGNGNISLGGNGARTIFAGNTVQSGTSATSISLGGTGVGYVIGNRFECTSFATQSVNGKSCTMLSVTNGDIYVVSNRFVHDVDGLLAFDANDTIRGIYSAGGDNRYIYNNLFEFNDGGEFFSKAGIVQGIYAINSTVNDIANNLVIYKGGMPEPTKGDAAIYVEGVGRATNNMVVGYAGTALASNNDILEFVYNLCSGVGDLGLCTPDKNNLSVAPQFAEQVDYTLAGGSPAVNGGDPGLHLSDLDGTRSDIGLHGGRFGFLQFDQQRAASNKPYIYPLFDEINLSNLNAVEVKAVSVARFK